MAHLTMRGIPVLTNPRLRPGLDALSWWLEDNHYSRHALERILAHAALAGTPTGSAYLESGDEAAASEAFTAALEPVPFDDPAWADESVYLDRESLLETAKAPGDADRSIPPGAVLVPPELEDLDQVEPGAAAVSAAILADEPALADAWRACMPPIAGGAPGRDDDPMAFPPSRPAPPLPDRLTVDGLAGVARVLAAFDDPRAW